MKVGRHKPKPKKCRDCGDLAPSLHPELGVCGSCWQSHYQEM